MESWDGVWSPADPASTGHSKSPSYLHSAGWPGSSYLWNRARGPDVVGGRAREGPAGLVGQGRGCLPPRYKQPGLFSPTGFLGVSKLLNKERGQAGAWRAVNGACEASSAGRGAGIKSPSHAARLAQRDCAKLKL
jgi:hypothetical protein